jgi:hypothetical protein
MRKFLINLLVTVLGFYVVVSFISYHPNPIDWDKGGRAAFAFFSLMIAGVYTAFEESEINNQKSKI